ncbi:MAG: hemerythrin domain-containing protein [Terracidiphilus sp.]
MTKPSPIFSYRSDHTKLNDIGSNNENSGLQICPCIENGERPLVDKGILAGMVLGSQRAAEAVSEPAPSLLQGSLSELIQYIVRTHHGFIRDELPRLHALCERVMATRRWMNPELIEITRKLRRLSGDLTFHMSHTENKVFPYIEALERSRKDGPSLALSSAAQAESLIEEVMVGHSPLGEMLRQLEADTNGFTPPEDACPDMIGLYDGLKELARRRSNHIQLEGYVLLPRALALAKEVLAA